MVTVRTYWNPADAAVAKSLLDNYEIRCAILHENLNLYSEGAQFAVPLRLVVDEDQLLRAEYLLNGEFDKAGDIEVTETAAVEDVDGDNSIEKINWNPWELLVLASWLLLPAFCVLLIRAPAAFSSRPGRRYAIAHITVFHLLSWLAIAFAAGLIILYFRVRRSGRNAESMTRGVKEE